MAQGNNQNNIWVIAFDFLNLFLGYQVDLKPTQTHKR